MLFGGGWGFYCRFCSINLLGMALLSAPLIPAWPRLRITGTSVLLLLCIILTNAYRGCDRPVAAKISRQCTVHHFCSFLEKTCSRPGLSNFLVHQNPLEHSLITYFPGFPIQEVWGGTGEYAFCRALGWCWRCGSRDPTENRPSEQLVKAHPFLPPCPSFSTLKGRILGQRALPSLNLLPF